MIKILREFMIPGTTKSVGRRLVYCNKGYSIQRYNNITKKWVIHMYTHNKWINDFDKIGKLWDQEVSWFLMYNGAKEIAA